MEHTHTTNIYNKMENKTNKNKQLYVKNGKYNNGKGDSLLTYVN